MKEHPRPYMKLVRLIDKYVGELSGKIFSLLILPLVGGLTYEVVARYLFNAPTFWAYDISYMIYGSHFMLGATYTLYMSGHIRTDIFYGRWSARRQGQVDLFLYLFFFFPGMIFFFAAGWTEALHAWEILERSEVSAWKPPLYPFKAVIPMAAVLLLIQGVSEFLKSLHAALTGRWP